MGDVWIFDDSVLIISSGVLYDSFLEEKKHYCLTVIKSQSLLFGNGNIILISVFQNTTFF